MSEAIAEFAERDFYISLYHEDGPLAGRPVTSSRIKSFLAMDDAQLMADIENRYWKAKAKLITRETRRFPQRSEADAGRHRQADLRGHCRGLQGKVSARLAAAQPKRGIG